MASDQEINIKMKTKIIISQCGMQQRVCNFYQKEIAAALTVHINVLLVLEFQNRNYFLICYFGMEDGGVDTTVVNVWGKRFKLPKLTLYVTYSTTHQRSVEVQFGRYQKNILQE